MKYGYGRIRIYFCFNWVGCHGNDLDIVSYYSKCKQKLFIIETSFENAENNISKITNDVLGMDGMKGMK